MKKRQPITSGFTQAGVYARRQFCVDLEVCRPPEPLWNPPRLREAATTLSVTLGHTKIEKVKIFFHKTKKICTFAPE